MLARYIVAFALVVTVFAATASPAPASDVAPTEGVVPLPFALHGVKKPDRHLPSAGFARIVAGGDMHVARGHGEAVTKLYHPGLPGQGNLSHLFYKGDEFEFLGVCVKRDLVGCAVTFFDYRRRTIREYRVHVDMAVDFPTYDLIHREGHGWLPFQLPVAGARDGLTAEQAAFVEHPFAMSLDKEGVDIPDPHLPAVMFAAYVEDGEKVVDTGDLSGIVRVFRKEEGNADPSALFFLGDEFELFGECGVSTCEVYVYDVGGETLRSYAVPMERAGDLRVYRELVTGPTADVPVS
jgi:hypothetical protein